MISKTLRHSRALLTTVFLIGGIQVSTAVETARQYLSGHGPSDAVPWDFTVTKGRRAGEKTTIPVPSQWDQQGFGTYDYGNSPGPKSDEHGIYQTKFTVPPEWKDRRIRLVFEGVMTDAAVKVNGKTAGPVHQGGFTRFRHDITGLVKPGKENLLEVDVAKVSANAATEIAERHGDYWVFGGIYRPVWLEVLPKQFIEQVSLDARADGTFRADIDLGNRDVRDADRVMVRLLDAGGRETGEPISASIPGGGTSRVHLEAKVASPRLWTAETPELYQAKVSLMKGGQEVHTVTEKFGFRSIEVRQGEGIFVNGKRVLLKGVCRHSFRPETGRALDTGDCLEDIKLLKEMNMNAVRMSHYPPDVAFLDLCDELGLYVIDELSGWQRAHDTENGRKLIREMITRDVNHPSILFWDNGNEGGWNRELDGDFALYDPQGRVVLHPWEAFNGVDTKHYPSYDDLTKRLEGPDIVMPTEMIHALHDGGAGSGLDDYLKAISGSRFGGGGFIWALVDEGIMRTDENNRIDVFSTYAPDGIVGPHHEKKGSFYTVRDVFNPVQVDAPVLDGKFAGDLSVHNRYDFLSLDGCRFDWKLIRFPDPAAAVATPEVLASGNSKAPDIAARADGQLKLDLPENWQEADALSLTVTDARGADLWTWTWPTPALGKRLAEPDAVAGANKNPAGDGLTMISGSLTATFDPRTGMLLRMSHGGKTSALTHGPRVVYARPASGEPQWIDAPGLTPDSSGTALWTLETPRMMNLLEITMPLEKNVDWWGFRLEISPDGSHWDLLYDSTRRAGDGNGFEFPPQQVAAVRISRIRQAGEQPGRLKRVRAAYQADRFPSPGEQSRTVTSGEGWVESVAADGKDRFRWSAAANDGLRLDYSYPLDGTFVYQGITFDHPEEDLVSVKWLGDGPSRVWQNRLRGAGPGVYETARNDIQPGESWNFPEFQGYFAGLRWARFDTRPGSLTVVAADPATFLRIGTPRIAHPNTTAPFPAGDLSFLKVIPAMGTKFSTPGKSGPASQPAKVSGLQGGSLVFHFGD